MLVAIPPIVLLVILVTCLSTAIIVGWWGVHSEAKDCDWWGWWLRYPLDNMRRVWRNRTS